MKRLTSINFFSRSFYTIFAPWNNESILFKYAVRHISPFEGSPRAGVAEYVYGGMLKNLSVDKISLFVEFICAKPTPILPLHNKNNPPKTNE